MRLKIGLDLDDTVNYWFPIYLERFGQPKNDQEITKNVERVLKHDRKFWTTLPVKNRPDFEVTLYCTKRVSPKSYTKKWLRENNMPDAPVYQMVYQKGNKADMIKGRVDVFIDDSISNFIMMNLSGVPCLLMDAEHNQEWGNIGRIHSLNYEEIKEAYNLFMRETFNNFKELL